ncbi:MAG TPA: GNAT family N-acetyltransferase [Anaerolineae bacterium]
MTQRWGAEIVVAHRVVYRPHELPGFGAWRVQRRETDEDQSDLKEPSSSEGNPTRGSNFQLDALQADSMVGLVTLHVVGNSCEIVSIDSMQPGKGIGAALLDAAIAYARQANCTRLWLISTNDNLNALRFYQKRGMVLVTIHRNALTRSRQLKPEIPLIGNDGIPLRDEIELEMTLEPES